MPTEPFSPALVGWDASLQRDDSVASLGRYARRGAKVHWRAIVSRSSAEVLDKIAPLTGGTLLALVGWDAHHHGDDSVAWLGWYALSGAKDY